MLFTYIIYIYKTLSIVLFFTPTLAALQQKHCPPHQRPLTESHWTLPLHQVFHVNDPVLLKHSHRQPHHWSHTEPQGTHRCHQVYWPLLSNESSKNVHWSGTSLEGKDTVCCEKIVSNKIIEYNPAPLSTIENAVSIIYVVTFIVSVLIFQLWWERDIVSFTLTIIE